MDDKSGDRLARTRAIMRWALAALFVTAGVAHLAVPDILLTITPDWVPFARQVIFVTGLCESPARAALVTAAVALLGRHRAGALCAVRMAG